MIHKINGVQADICNPDISDLSPELQTATVEVVASILAVLRAHQGDPERGDVGWRRQTVGEHLGHAADHAFMAHETWDDVMNRPNGLDLDDDGLPHEDHALCRIMLAKAKRRLG